MSKLFCGNCKRVKTWREVNYVSFRRGKIHQWNIGPRGVRTLCGLVVQEKDRML